MLFTVETHSRCCVCDSIRNNSIYSRHKYSPQFFNILNLTEFNHKMCFVIGNEIHENENIIISSSNVKQILLHTLKRLIIFITFLFWIRFKFFFVPLWLLYFDLGHKITIESNNLNKETALPYISQFFSWFQALEIRGSVGNIQSSLLRRKI